MQQVIVNLTFAICNGKTNVLYCQAIEYVTSNDGAPFIVELANAGAATNGAPFFFTGGEMSKSFLAVRVREDHMARLQTLAKSTGLKPSVVLRLLIERAEVQPPVRVSLPRTEQTNNNTGAESAKSRAGVVSN